MARGRGWRFARNAGALIAINAAFALVAVAGRGLPPPWDAVVNVAVPGFIVSTIISSLCALVVSLTAPTLFHRTTPLVRWTTLVVMLVGLAAVGTLLGIAAITALGYVPARRDAFVATLQRTFNTAVIITLIFGVLTVLYETMRSRLNDARLVLRTKERDEAEARRIASEAQLASLEARVNPHFFFNTLNSIASLTREDPARAERMTTQLASLMRSSLDRGSSPLVPLEHELQTVRDYLDIEHERLGSRLRYDIQAEEALRAVLVPRLALQTLVENSVKFAVSPRREGASITVRAHASNGRVRIDVADDGPGFDAAAIPDGHGLALLRARLAMTFGNQASLTIDGRATGTVITLDFPSRAPGH